jgi:regulator of sirC expression with transglutaminase-like and TPR domain
VSARPALLAALGLALAGCRRPSPPAPTPPSPFLAELLALAGVSPGADTDAQLAAVDQVVNRARLRLARGEPPADAFSRALFEDLGYEREIDDRSPRTMLLPPVLEARRGGCVGLGTLYLAAAERAGVAAHGVLVPGHFFVRAPDGRGGARNVELLRRGEQMPAAWYRERYGLPVAGPLAPAYLRELDAREVLAVLRFNLGNERRVRGDPAQAAALYGRAAADFPDFAEAHASVGLSAQLLGDRAAAAAAYARAHRVYPGLPGLEQNMAALAREADGGAR